MRTLDTFRPFVFVVFVLVLVPAIVMAGASSAGPVDLTARSSSAECADGDRWLGPELARFFFFDPRLAPDAVIAGEALDRLTWSLDAPAFPGDVPGSLTAEYDSTLPAGLFGFRLPRALDQDDTFTAAAVFVIHSEGFSSDPNGFFQISWGLWNEETTGLNRTGSFDGFAGDTFDLLEFNYFPNVSPFFGGPFLSPALLGAADVDNPAFDGSGSFANGSFLFDLAAELPLDEPLMAVLSHRPRADALVLQVYRVIGPFTAIPVNGAVGVVDLTALSLREYTLDAVGLTLWNDGFSGPAPSVQATLTFHALYVRRGGLFRHGQVFSAFGRTDD